MTTAEMTENTGSTPSATRLADRLHPRNWRRGFRNFRRTRPFWGSLVLLAGAYFVGHPILGGGFAFVVDLGTKALTPLGLAFGMAAAALVSLFLPSQRHFPAVIATALSIASLPLANLGGWLIGMVLGILGSGLIFAWTPYSDKQLAKFAAKAERKQARAAARTGNTGKETAAAA